MPDLEYTVDQINILIPTLFRHMEYKILKKTFKIKSSDPYVYWMYLWEHYGDPTIPPFPKELIPPAAADTSSDEITPPAPVVPTDPVPAIDASDSVQQEILCLPTSASWDGFLPDMEKLFMESHIEDVGDILDDIHLLFEADTPSFTAVIDSCTSALQGTHDLPSDDFLPDISVLFLESHTTYMGDFYDDFSLLFAEESSTVVARAHSDPQVHALHDQSFQIGVIVDSSLQLLQEVSLTFEKTAGVLRQVLEISVIIEIPPPSRGFIS